MYDHLVGAWQTYTAEENRMSYRFEDELREFYQLFNAGKLDDLVSRFIPSATYHQHNMDRTAVGHHQIRTFMTGWRGCFEGAQIMGVSIIKAQDRIQTEVSNAAECLLADFTLAGVYARTPPGLEDDVPATKQPVSFSVGETVWFDDSGQIIRVHSTFNLAALRRRSTE